MAVIMVVLHCCRSKHLQTCLPLQTNAHGQPPKPWITPGLLEEIRKKHLGCSTDTKNNELTQPGQATSQPKELGKAKQDSVHMYSHSSSLKVHQMGREIPRHPYQTDEYA